MNRTFSEQLLGQKRSEYFLELLSLGFLNDPVAINFVVTVTSL